MATDVSIRLRGAVPARVRRRADEDSPRTCALHDSLTTQDHHS